MSNVWLRVRDCFRCDGCEYVVDLVNESRARGQPLSYETVSVLRRSKKTGLRRLRQVRRRAGEDNFSICPVVDSEYVTRRMSAEEFNEFLAKRNRPDGDASESEEGSQTQTTERLDSMSKKEKKATTKDANQNEKPTQGRAAYIHELKEKGKSMADAMPLVQEKFNCPEGLFKKIWKRSARGEGGEEEATTTKKASTKSKKSATPPAKSKKSSTPPPAPPVEKSPTPPTPPAPPAESSETTTS